MNTWADESEDSFQPAPSSYTGERPKLNLKPRSQTKDPTTPPTTSASSSKSNPFGAAKPRELVLQSKGIDPAAADKKAERKAGVVRLTDEQNRRVEAVRAELEEIEAQLREANENELPEEEYRVAAERKRDELNELMKEFQSVNLRDAEGSTTRAEEEERRGGKREETRKFERPSERRRRLE
ncbi:hypothetical protein ACHAWX_000187, partial [Stephanocyclus meneghinianus]